MFNELSVYFWAAFFGAGMYIGGMNAKALTSSIMYGLGLLAVYPDTEKAVMLILLYIPAVLLSSFRD